MADKIRPDCLIYVPPQTSFEDRRSLRERAGVSNHRHFALTFDVEPVARFESLRIFFPVSCVSSEAETDKKNLEKKLLAVSDSLHLIYVIFSACAFLDRFWDTGLSIWSF
jgi:hypothetical protein